MIDDDARAIARAEWRAGWRIPLVSMVALCVSYTHFYTLGVMMPSIERELGWSRAFIASGITVLGIASVFLAPMIGMAIDRVGPRRIAIVGAVIYSAAFASLGLVQPPQVMWWLTWLLVTLGSVAMAPTVFTSAVASFFVQTRGLAFGITLCGAGLSSLIYPLVTHALMDRMDWRHAFMAIGLVNGVISLALIVLFFDRNRAAVPDGSRHAPGVHGGFAATWPLMRSGIFLRLCFVSLFYTLGMTAILVHLTPMLGEFGLGGSQAVVVASLVGVTSVMGRLGIGALLDHVAPHRLGPIAFCFPIAVCVLALATHGGAFGVLIAVFMGVAIGSEIDIIAFQSARSFALEHYGTLYGVLIGLASLGGGIGPMLSGAVHDASHSYAPVFWMLLPVFVVSAILIAIPGPRQDAPR